MITCTFIRRLLDAVCDEVRIIPILGPIREAEQPVKPSRCNSQPARKRNLLMAFSMSDSQQVTVTIKAVDKKGNAATLDGVPEWSSDNSDVLALTPSPDGMSCLVQAVGPLGTGNITMKADADLGTGTTEIVGTLEVDITGGQATVVTLDPGPVSEQP